MNYEQKYKESMLIAKHHVMNGALSQDEAEALFPELRESEDERKANALIRLLNNEKVSSLITFEAKQQWIDWLKRKKIPSVSFEPPMGFDSGSAVVYHNAESEDERIRKAIMGLTYIDGIEPILIKCSITAQDIRKYLEKQKEQKSVDIDKPRKDIYQSGYNDGYQHGREDEQKEQKPVELDEEIELGLDRARQIVFAAKGNLGGYQSDDGIYECDSAIEAIDEILKNGITTKPAEWSEEDEKMLKLIISELEAEGKDVNVPELYRVEINWLKSLRPSWKPSEEQMEAFEESLMSVAYTENKTILESLYEQLKAL